MLKLAITVLASVTVWILLVGSVKPQEMIVGAICVLLTLWFTYYVAKHDCPKLRLRFIDWIEIWRVPGYLLLDTWVILSVLAKDVLHLAPAPSLFRAAPFECNPDESLDIARRVLAVAYTTVTPNMIVIGIDVPTGQMLFHQLRKSGMPSMTHKLGAGMNAWLITAIVVSGCLIPCADMSLRGSPERRLVGVEMTGIILTIVLVLFTVGTNRLPFIDLALATAIMSFGSGLVFARFLEKHL